MTVSAVEPLVKDTPPPHAPHTHTHIINSSLKILKKGGLSWVVLLHSKRGCKKVVLKWGSVWLGIDSNGQDTDVCKIKNGITEIMGLDKEK